MKSITYQKGQDTFSLVELPTPQLETEHDVLIRVHAVGLNPVDAKVHLWHGMVPDMADDFVCGLDVSGEIVATGNAVTDWQVGDMVLYHGDMRRTRGGFAEFAVQDARSVTPHPAVSSALAAATPCAAWTAYRALVNKLAIDTRQSIFIAGGAGGVGSFAIQLARHFGVKQIITSASAGKHQYVRELGATEVIDYRNEDVVARVIELTNGEGVDVSLDCVGGDNALQCASVLGYEGEMVELVSTVNPTQYPGAFMKGLSFHQLSLGSGHVHGDKGRQTLVQAGHAVSTLLSNGTLEVPELLIIPLEEIGEALKTMRAERTTGKIVAQLVD